ncbi:MAG: hypothetical protein ACAH88_21220 [Roseimicrobium sp.]
MKSLSPLLLAALCVCLCAAPFTHAADSPFTLTVVPSRSQAPPPAGRFITMADEKPDVFHVVLTNVSNEVQPVFESWNSWGYQAIQFELTLPDGKQTVVSVSDQDFTRNFPSKFYIPPGEHQVFPIHLDKRWEMNPSVALGRETAITLKAIYEITESPESKEYHVWTGRVESKPCKLTLWHQAKD